MIPSFSCKPLPHICFGVNRTGELPGLISRFGRRILVVLGGQSFVRSSRWPKLKSALAVQSSLLAVEQVHGEPAPEMIDALVDRYRDQRIEVVLAIGGGSVIDAGKAVSAMLMEKGEICRYLEGVGSEKPSGRKVPFIAVPTTAGTGSEATSNAVLSRTGSHGFKRSLRHDNYIPDIALIDPILTLSCPRELTIACGMDTFTQLVEAYLSTHASPFTDALALDGIQAVQRSLRTAWSDGGNLDARSDMAYAAMISGIVLAQAGLGVVHGFASAIGGFFAAPHGVICGSLMAAGNRITLDRLRRTGENHVALEKYSRLGELFTTTKNADPEYYQDICIAELEKLTEELAIPRLGGYGIIEDHLEAILDQSGNKYNPAELDYEEMRAILRQRL